MKADSDRRSALHKPAGAVLYIHVLKSGVCPKQLCKDDYGPRAGVVPLTNWTRPHVLSEGRCVFPLHWPSALLGGPAAPSLVAKSGYFEILVGFGMFSGFRLLGSCVSHACRAARFYNIEPSNASDHVPLLRRLHKR